MRTLALIILTLAGTAAPALAADRNGYAAIASGDLATAERSIVAERQVFPDRPELMLNLAAIYGKTGRAAQARALYLEVLKRPTIAMDMPSGAVTSSHDVAHRGLVRFGDQIATR